MELHELTSDLAVAGQIGPADIPVLAAKGIRAIICNRPDGEAPEQPSYREIERAAAALGIEIVYQPVQSGAMGDGDVQAFEKALNTLPKPALAYCRSGTRCAALWSLSEVRRRPVQDIVRRAMEAGYDLRGLLPRLEEASRKP
jgi:sulfide:quinone oxidoreductase